MYILPYNFAFEKREIVIFVLTEEKKEGKIGVVN